MAPHPFSRRENSATTNEIFASYLVAGSICFVVLLCLLSLICFYRSRANRKRTAEQTTELFCVRGVVQPMMTETNPLSTRASASPSQHGLTASIVAPKISHKPSSHALSDKAVASSEVEPSPACSTLSFHRPLSNASFGPPRLRTISILNPTSPRHSRASSGFTAYAQYFFPPGLSPRPTSSISTSSSQVKPVRQLFKSALPDELSLVRYGEYLTVLRSFDDGWCLVARNALCSSPASRLSTWMTSDGDNIEIGLIPTWVFIKPFRGVTVTRPFRSASVNALHLAQNPAPAYTGDTIISGSEFA